MAFSFVPHCLRVREKFRREVLAHQNLPGGNSTPNIIWEYLQNVQTAGQIQADHRWGLSGGTESRKAFVVSRLERDPPGGLEALAPGGILRFSGIVSLGEFGYSSSLVDMNTAETTYERTTQDAELLPFFFMFAFPPDRADLCYFVSQRTGTLGVMGSFAKAVTAAIKSRDETITAEFKSIVPTAVTDYLDRNPKLSAVRLLRRDLPQDALDQLGVPRGAVGEVELVIKPKRTGRREVGFQLRRVLESLRPQGGELGATGVVEVLGEEFHSVKLDVNVGGRKRVVALSNRPTLRWIHEPSPPLELDPGTGWPRYEDLHQEADTLLADLLHGEWMIKGEQESSEEE